MDSNDETSNNVAFRVGLNGRGGLAEEADTASLRWTHYRGDDDAISDLLMRDRRLADHIADSMMTQNARPRVSVIEDGLLVVLRGVNSNPGSDPEDMVSMRAWVDADRIVTVSPRRVLAVEDVHAALAKGSGPKSPIGALVHIADSIVERMRPVVDGLEDTVDDLHERLLTKGPNELQRPLADLRHVIAQLRRHMAPQRDALRQFVAMRTKLMSDEDLGELIHTADRQSRYVEDVDSVRERATVLQDELNNTVANEMNRNMYLMSIIAAVFLPLGFLTGLLGINVGGIPGTESPLAFWIVCALLVGIAVAEVWWFRRRRLL